MSFTIHGIGVSGGIAIGHAHLLSHAQLEVEHYTICRTPRWRRSRRASTPRSPPRAPSWPRWPSTSPPMPPPEFEGFLNLHLMILGDSTLSEAPRELIAARKCNAEWAVSQQAEELIDQFERIEDEYLRERKADVVQVVERVLKALTGQPRHHPGAAPQGRGQHPGGARPLAG